MNVGELLADKRVCICGGSGGVGKTTISASIAMGMAAEGRKVDLDLPGELWAMMLDSKRTFDQLIEHLAPDERTRDEVLANRIYQQLSSAVAGSQEFTAIAKLYELDREGDYDVLVLDTPPWTSSS